LTPSRPTDARICAMKQPLARRAIMCIVMDPAEMRMSSSVMRRGIRGASTRLPSCAPARDNVAHAHPSFVDLEQHANAARLNRGISSGRPRSTSRGQSRCWRQPRAKLARTAAQIDRDLLHGRPAVLRPGSADRARTPPDQGELWAGPVHACSRQARMASPRVGTKAHPSKPRLITPRLR
jgi:hypothetical protein